MFDQYAIRAYNKRARQDYNSVGFALIWQSAFVLAAQFIYAFVVTMMGGNFQDYFLIYFLSVVQNIIPFIYFFLKHRQTILPFFKLRSRISIKRILAGSAFALGSNAIFSMIIGIVVMILVQLGIQSTTPDFSMSGTSAQNLIMLFFLFIGAPVTEEILYRGMLYPVLRKYGATFAILSTSLIFAISHGNLQQALPTFFVGVTLAYVTEMSGSIYEAIFIHMINNGIATLTSILPEDVSSMMVLLLMPAAIAIFVIWLVRGKKPNNNPYVPKSTRWLSFWSSPTIIIAFVLYIGFILLSFSSL